MKKLLDVLGRVVTALTAAASMAAGLCILTTAFMVTYEVVMRGLFDAPTEWSIEVSVYLVMVAGFLGMAVAYADDKHICVDLLTEKMGLRARKICQILSGVVMLAFTVIFTAEATEMVLSSIELGRTSPSTLRVPLFVPQLSLPIGYFLLFAEIVRKVAGLFSGDLSAARGGEKT